MIISVQVSYRHGLVKTFLADGETLLEEFCRRVRSRGEVRSMRGFRDANAEDQANAMLLANEKVK